MFFYGPRGVLSSLGSKTKENTCKTEKKKGKQDGSAQQGSVLKLTSADDGMLSCYANTGQDHLKV